MTNVPFSYYDLTLECDILVCVTMLIIASEMANIIVC